jgi:hypothetical protein
MVGYARSANPPYGRTLAGKRMSDTQPTHEEPGKPALIAGWMDGIVGFVRGPAGIMAGVMALLALIGTGVTIAGAEWARGYWLTLVPVYGVLCVLTAWYHTGHFTGSVMRQILHWLSVAVVIALDLALLRRGEQAAAGTGLSSLLILALGCLLAGIHLEWLFALVGLLLLAIFIVVSVGQQFVIIAFLIAAVAALVFAAYWALTRR